MYWYWYDTSSDVLYLALALALFKSISYTSVKHKALAAGLVIWFGYCMVSNIMTDYAIVGDVVVSNLLAAFIVAALAVAFSMRFLLHWRPNNMSVTDGKFYEVIGKPENLSQVLVAIYTGRGGAFGITDGVHLWHYSKQSGCMVSETFDRGYMMGRMGKEICASFEDGRSELNSMVGQEFTTLHNCLELRSLARKWS